MISNFDLRLAVIDGTDASVASVGRSLTKALGPDSMTDEFARGQEAQLAYRILHRATLQPDPARSKSRQNRKHSSSPELSHVGIALALFYGEEVVLVDLGGGQANVCKANGVLAPIAVGEKNALGARIWTTRLGIGDSVILTGREVAKQVPQSELRHTVQASVSPSRAAEWLVTLAKGRGEVTSTAVVAQVTGVWSPPSIVIPETISKFGSYIPVPRLRTVGLGSAVAAAMLVGVSLGPVMFSGSSAAGQLAGADQLRVEVATTDAALLDWRDPTGAATAYRVTTDHRTFVTTHPHLAIRGLQSGKSYIWNVTSMFGDQLSRHSASAILTTSGKPRPVTPSTLSPDQRAVIPPQNASSVHLCWVAPQTESLFALFLSGAGRHMRLTLPRTELKRNQNGSICVKRSLPSEHGIPGVWESARTVTLIRGPAGAFCDPGPPLGPRSGRRPRKCGKHWNCPRRSSRDGAVTTPSPRHRHLCGKVFTPNVWIRQLWVRNLRLFQLRLFKLLIHQLWLLQFRLLNLGIRQFGLRWVRRVRPHLSVGNRWRPREQSGA